MIHIHNATGTLDDAELLRALSDQVEPAVRNRLEEWHDAAEALAELEYNAREAGYEAAQAEFEPGHDAWRDLFNLWQDEYGNGRWPGADPADGNLQRVMHDDFTAGAQALDLLRQIAADKFVAPALEAREFLEQLEVERG